MPGRESITAAILKQKFVLQITGDELGEPIGYLPTYWNLSMNSQPKSQNKAKQWILADL